MTANLSDPIIRTSALSRTYRSGAEQRVFGPVTVPRGRIVALVGSSGSGKTTLLNLLAGLVEPDQQGKTGTPSIELYFSGIDPVDIGTNPDFERRRIGLVFQDGLLLANQTVGLNVAAPNLARGAAVGHARIERLFRKLSLAPSYRTKRAWQLSGGEAQRVAFSRALLQDPELLFADEPTSNLDRRNAEGLMRIVAQWWAGDPSRTVLWVTHDLELAVKVAHSFLVLTGDNDPAVPLVPRENPGSVEVVEAWLHGTAPPQAGAAPSVYPPLTAVAEKEPWREPAPSAPEKRVANLARRMAYTEMFSRRGGLKDEAQQRPLSDVLAHTQAGSGEGRWRGMATAMVAAFGDWLSLIFCMVCFVLVVCVALGWLINQRSYQARVNDPMNCHVIVRGNALYEATLNRLSSRPWEGDAPEFDVASLPADALPTALVEPTPSSCRAGPAAFGRKDMPTLVNVGVRGGNGECERLDIAVSLLVTKASEPILRSVRLLAGERGQVMAPSATLLRQLAAAPRTEQDLYLTATALEKIAKKIGAKSTADIGEVCLLAAYIPAEFAVFRVRGMVDRLPAERSSYDGFVTETVYDSFTQGRVRNYVRAAIYFNPANIKINESASGANAALGGKLGRQLDRLGLDYSRDNLLRLVEFQKTLDEVNIGMWFLGCLLVVAVLAFLYFWTSSYLEQNTRAFATLKAFGLPRRTIIAQLSWHAGTNVSMGAVTTIVALGLIYVPVWLYVPELAGRLPAGADIVISLAVGWLVMTALALAAGAAACCAWWSRHRYVAESLAG